MSMISKKRKNQTVVVVVVVVVGVVVEVVGGCMGVLFTQHELTLCLCL